MKNTKIVMCVLITSASMVANAHLGSVHVEASGEPGLQEFISEHDLPRPGSGIQIVPYAQMAISKDKKFDIKTFEADKKLGYIRKKSEDAIELIKTKNNKYYPGTKATFEKNSDPYDTRLKASLSQLKLAFPFDGISFIKKEDVIGYAVAGGWENGWTGVAEYFNDPIIGICDYVKNNARLNQSAARLIKEYITYDINAKPTLVSAQGEDKGGYSYKVEWFDEEYYHTLTCASKNFSKEYTVHAVDLAKRIDSEN